MSLNDIDDTLVEYFKQMLDEEASASGDLLPEENVETQSLDSCVSDLNAFNADADAAVYDQTVEVIEDGAMVLQTDISADADDIDYAADDYVPESEELEEDPDEYGTAFESADSDYSQSQSSFEPEVQLESASESESSQPLPYAEHKSLESLLENVETKTQTQVQTQVETETAVEEAAAQTEEKTEETAVEENTDEGSVNPYEWENISMPNEFQVLFFLVKGIRFAVPLVNLGGIFQTDKITKLFGKPSWFMGLADIRGRKMNVVDTLKWVKSDAPSSDNYEYMIVLDKTLWSIGCDKLEGNRILSRDNITWRQQAGNRPWLAGIVKKEMCALLHVEALIKMFENGVNLKDLDVQMSA